MAKSPHGQLGDLFWKAINPKDHKRDDIAMTDGRKVEYHAEDAPAGKYTLVAHCIGKGLTSLRNIEVNMKVVENGQVTVSYNKKISPVDTEAEHSFLVHKSAKIDVVCTGSAAYSIATIHLKVALYRQPIGPSASSSASLPAFPAVSPNHHDQALAPPSSSSSKSSSSSAYSHTVVTPPEIPLICWSKSLADSFPDHKEFSVTPYEAMRLAGLGLRMKQYIDEETSQGRLPVMNPFKKSPAGPRMVRERVKEIGRGREGEGEGEGEG